MGVVCTLLVTSLVSAQDWERFTFGPEGDLIIISL